MSKVKEPHYFVREEARPRLASGVWDSLEYERLWSSRGNELRGEASVLYLSFARMAVESMLGEVDLPPKVILSIRNPIDRAFSSYLDVRMKNPEEVAPTFEDAVAREFRRGPWRLDGEGSPTLRHLALGCYTDGIEVFRQALGQQNVHLVLFDEFKDDVAGTLAQILRFLNLDAIPIREPIEANRGGKIWQSRIVGGVMRSHATVRARRLLRDVAPQAHARLSRLVTSRFLAPAPSMAPGTAQQLAALYSDEIRRLETMFGRSLGHWYPAG